MKLPRQAHCVDRKTGAPVTAAGHGGIRAAAANLYSLLNMFPKATSGFGAMLNR